MSELSATAWRMILDNPDLAERVTLLPIELRRELSELIEALCDMAQEAFGLPYGSSEVAELGRKVQTSGATGSVRSTRRPHLARLLRGSYVRRVSGFRTAVRRTICLDEPDGYRGPYEPKTRKTG